MYKMFIDDLRDAEKHYPNEGFIVTRTYNEAVQYVQEHGLPSFVSFDHDLGDTDSTDEKTGYSFAKFLIEYMIDNDLREPFEYFIHSANPVGAENIKQYLQNGFNFIQGQA
ncbi:hypothetical protein EJP02_132 [Escherichia phage EJP2]|nr:hypothetical protein EJP02_132 [Escherichia phage EJP2]